ncbi:MAG: ATP-binding cassette domain-containing protein [Eubacteriales bacterium]|nr:ATP-binding cassette domain-containing protein [Eubacteriales bacterium]
MIQVSGLTRRYGAVAAVSALSFRVQEGEIVGFLGPNGAGKTTTMNMLTGCLRPTAGSVTLGGFDIETDADQARKMIGYLPENPPLYPDMTVEEYLGFVYQLKKCTMPRDTHLEQVCTMAGLTDVRGRLIRNLSKGYRQRVGLAQALIGDPQVLILDEPTVGLDPKQIIEIREVIRSLGRQHTVILSSHILSEVQAVCDRVLVIDHGKIVADGTPSELSARMEGAEQLDMTIEGAPELVLPALRAVPGVATAVVVTEDGKKSVYRITAESDADIRRAVFDALSQNHMAILSMQQVALSLEDIFLQLTGAESAEAAPEPAEAKEPSKKKKRRLFGRKRGDDK